MAVAIKRLSHRRIVNGLLLALAIVLCVFLWRLFFTALLPHALYSGFALLALVLILTLFNARKKLPFLPLLKASHWLQFHIYAGFLSIFLYGLHTSFRIPTGTLEITLAALFAVVTISGVIGLALSRLLPRLMTRTGEPLPFEKIPAFEIQLRREAETLIETNEREAGPSALGDAYLTKLSSYFGPRSSFLLLLNNPERVRIGAHQEIDDIERYTVAEEQPILQRMRELIDLRHNINIQKASQLVLRSWLFIHIPFTYSMVIVALVHAWIAFHYTVFP